MYTKHMENMDPVSTTLYGGNFPSREAALDFFRLEDGVPRRLYEEMYLQGDFHGAIELRFFPKKSNQAEELFADFPGGDAIVSALQERFLAKLKRRVNTAVAIRGFYLPAHFTGRPMSAMTEKRTADYHVFCIEELV